MQFDFQPKPFEEFDIDIEVEYCGVCGSDLHTLSGGWVSRAIIGLQNTGGYAD